MYRFAELYDVYVDKDEILIVGDEIYVLEELNKDEKEFIINLKKGISEEQFEEYQKMIDARKIIETLSENGFIRTEKNDYVGSKVERQVYYFESLGDKFNSMQSKLEEKSVCIVGLGGVGSVVIQHLVGAGIKKYNLIDFDQIEYSNLNRQFIYNQSHIGKSKLEIVRDYIINVEPLAVINTFEKFIGDEEGMSFLDNEKIDMLICAADIPIGKVYEEVSTYCFSRGIPHTFCGVGLDEGYWGPMLVPGKSSTYKNFIKKMSEDYTDIELKINNFLYGTKKTMKASFGPVNTIISSFLVYDVIRFLSEIETSQLINARNKFSLNTFENHKFIYNEEFGSK